MDQLSRAWGLVATTSKLCYTIAKNVGQYVATASGYIVTWTAEYAMKRRRAPEQQSVTTTGSSSRRRSASPPQRRTSGRRSPMTEKKAREARERRINRIISQSMQSRNRNERNEESNASQEDASFSASSPPALHREPAQFCIDESNNYTPPKEDIGCSTPDELSGELFRPTLTSTPTLFSSSPDHGTPLLSQSTVEDMAASIPGALSPYYPNIPTLSYSRLHARKKNTKILGGRQVSKSLQAAGEVPKYDNGVRKAYCISDEQRPPLISIDKNTLANKNTLMKQYRIPRGLQFIKNSRNESLARTSKRSQEVRKHDKAVGKKLNKKKNDPRLDKFDRALTRFVQAGERRKFAKLHSVSLVAAPLAPSPKTRQQHLRASQQSQQHHEEHHEKEEVALVEAAPVAEEPKIPQRELQEPIEPIEQEQKEEKRESPAESVPPVSASASSPDTPQQIESQRTLSS